MAEFEGIYEPDSPQPFSGEQLAMEATRSRERFADHGARIASVERYLGLSWQMASLLVVVVSIMVFILWNTVNNRMAATEDKLLTANASLISAIDNQSNKIGALEKKVAEHIHARDLPEKDPPAAAQPPPQNAPPPG